MVRPAGILAAVAVSVAAADLGMKALAVARHGDAVVLHERPGIYALVALAALAWSTALLAIGSPLVAAAGGLVLGGALANAASLALWPGVPDPLVARNVAFNLADIAALTGGLAAVPLAVAAVAIRDRGRLAQRVGGGLGFRHGR